MRAELASIVSCYGPDVFLVGHEHLYKITYQFLCILSILEFLHESMPVLRFTSVRMAPGCCSRHGVHLEVPGTSAVSLRRSLAYADPARYPGTPSHRPAAVFQVVPAMFVECAPSLILVLSDDGVDCLV